MDAPANEPEPTLVRPYLAGLGSAPINRPEVDAAAADVFEAAAVRSYAMTQGRAGAAIHLEFEAMLRLTDLGTRAQTGLTFERADIARLCHLEILSVAELSARLALPIGVIRVLAADLIVEGLLEAFMPDLAVAEDIDLIARLIEGVRAL